MREVVADAKTGYLVSLDQCPRCGGIWCDRWEVYPITSAAADRLDAVDGVALHAPSAAPAQPLECPRCRARMFRFHDPTLTSDTHIWRCPNCDGMWFNHGELRRLKDQHSGGTSGGRALSAVDVDHLATQITPPTNKSLPTVRHLAQAFEASGEPTTDGDAVRHELVAGAAWVIIRTVLRFLLHV